MSGILIASLIFSILATLGVGYIFYRILNIEDFIKEKITKKFNSVAGHKGKALIKAREAATEDMKDLIFEVPEIKQLFPKLNKQTMMGANADPSMFAGGMLGAFSDLAPLLGLVGGEDFSLVQLIPVLIQIVPRVVDFIAKRRAGKPKQLTGEEQKDAKAIPTTAKLHY